MALVVSYTSGQKRIDRDGHVVLSGTLAMDSSYPTGGEAVTGWDDPKILKVFIQKSGTFDFLYDHVAKKVVAWDTAFTAEASSTQDLSSLSAVPFELTYL